MPRLSDEERAALRDRILEFLGGTLIPHAKAEEDVLYPEWGKLLGFPEAAAPMIHDHEAIVAPGLRRRAARRDRGGDRPHGDGDRTCPRACAPGAGALTTLW